MKQTKKMTKKERKELFQRELAHVGFIALNNKEIEESLINLVIEHYKGYIEDGEELSDFLNEVGNDYEYFIEHYSLYFDCLVEFVDEFIYEYVEEICKNLTLVDTEEAIEFMFNAIANKSEEVREVIEPLFNDFCKYFENNNKEENEDVDEVIEELSEEKVKEDLLSVFSHWAYKVYWSMKKYDFKRMCWNVIENKEEKEFMIDCFADCCSIKKFEKQYEPVLNSIPYDWYKETFKNETINQI